MEAVIVLTNAALRLCEARTDNKILVVFRLPEGVGLTPGDRLEFHDFRLGRVEARKLDTDEQFEVVLEAQNLHDLLLPGGHGTSRTPSTERLTEE
jgi:hypothetical protein